MKWFEHRHWWRMKLAPSPVRSEGEKLPHMILILEDCSCGAVRQIEVRAGETPTARITIEKK